MIQAQGITFSHTGEPLYKKASFYVPKNKKVGLVGLNGSGKSTLFRLILKDDWPEEGTLRVEGNVLLVPQEVSHDPLQQKATSVRQYLHQAHPHKDHFLLQLLHNMELDELTLESVPHNLSGGQKTKLAILFAVLAQPDILLLDEPTNFLDTAGKKWVMHWLSRYKKTLFVVSHDLDLLDKHIHKVVYINKQTKQFEEYSGTYSSFKKLKADRDEHLTRYIKNQAQKIKKMKQSVERLRSKESNEKIVRQRVVLERRIQKMEEQLPELPQEIVRIPLQLPTPLPIGELPLMVRHLKKSYDSVSVLNDVSFSMQKGDRFAIIGHNGAGKSTLLKIIMGKLAADKGKVILDERAHVGYYSQEFETFDLTQTLYEVVREHTEADEGKIRSFLARFMFGPTRIRQTIGSLSGGEKTRLSIALLMLQNYNVLVLDEPTTYLDVLSQRIILEALKVYTGTILIVSHTPEFLQELSLDKALLLPEEKVVYWDDALLERSSQM